MFLCAKPDTRTGNFMAINQIDRGFGGQNTLSGSPVKQIEQSDGAKNESKVGEGVAA